MSTHAPRILVSALAALFMAGTAMAQSTGTTGGTAGSSSRDSGATTQDSSGATSTTSGAAKRESTRSAKLARADASFLKQAAQNGLAEVESSKLALTKAQNQQVKSYAQQMVDDHTKANEELKSLAQAKGVEVPNEPSVAQRGKMKLLEKSDADKFDQRYVEQMGVDAHQDNIKLFQKASKDAHDADVKSYASKTLPKLQEHLKLAQDLKATAEKDSNASASGTRKQQSQ
jgi:putative membrane protein